MHLLRIKGKSDWGGVQLLLTELRVHGAAAAGLFFALAPKLGHGARAHAVVGLDHEVVAAVRGEKRKLAPVGSFAHLPKKVTSKAGSRVDLKEQTGEKRERGMDRDIEIKRFIKRESRVAPPR